MRTSASRFAVVAIVAAAAVSIGACGSSTSKGNVKVATAPGGTKDQSKWPADDRTMCDWKDKPELEVSEYRD